MHHHAYWGCADFELERCLKESYFSENKMEYPLETSFYVTDKESIENGNFEKYP